MNATTTIRNAEGSLATGWQDMPDPEIMDHPELVGSWGLALGVDLDSCDPAAIRDGDGIARFAVELCDRIGMRRFGPATVVRFGADPGFAATRSSSSSRRRSSPGISPRRVTPRSSTSSAASPTPRTRWWRSAASGSADESPVPRSHSAGERAHAPIASVPAHRPGRIDPGLTETASGPSAHGIVGRSAERARIDAFLAASRTGVHALLLRGEAGIGKTALWGYALRRAREQDTRVLVARSSEDGLRVTLGGLTELFEDVEVDVASLEVSDALARGKGVLAGLRSLAAATPVIVAIDDLQWLDAESVRALRYAIRRLDADPLGIVATIRTGTIDDPLETLRVLPPGRSTSITVRPLDLDETRSLLRPFVAGIPRPVLRRIHEVSGGNPLYASELARVLPADRWPDPADIHPSTSIEAAIASRTEMLSPQVRQVLELVAALGRPTVAELQDGLDGLDLGVVLAQARQADLLVVVGDRVMFTHPLIASAVYERIDPLAKRSLHARLAHAASDPDVRARHLARASDTPDESVAVELEEAAVRASERDDLQLAAEFAARATRATPAHAVDSRVRRAALEIEARNGAGESARALELAQRLLLEVPRGPLRARALVAWSYVSDVDRATSEARLLEALEDAGDDDILRGDVLERLVRSGDSATPVAFERLEEAVALADRTGNRPLAVRARARLAHALMMAGTPRPDILAEAIALDDAAGGRTFPSPRTFQAKHLTWQGDLRGARLVLDSMDLGLVEEGHEPRRMQVLLDRALVECMAGAFDAANGMVSLGLEGAIDAEDTWAVTLFESMGVVAGVWQGTARDATDAARRIAARRGASGESQIVGRAHWSLGLSALSRGAAREAYLELRSALEALELAGIRHPGVEPALPDAVEAAAAEDRPAARELLERLDERVEPLDSAWLRALATRARAVVRLGEGRPDGSIEALRDAVGVLDGSGHAPDAARTLLVLGRTLVRAGHRTAAADAFDDAFGRFEGMGAVPWASACRRELERVAPGRAAGELTATEARLAELVAEGASNKEIAATMYVSVATVEAHLTRIYRKLDMRSRTDLTRWVQQRDRDGSRGRLGEAR